MKEFSVAERYKPIGSCKDTVFSLDRMIKDGFSEYLISVGINLELLSYRIEVEKEEDRLQERFMEICRSNPDHNALEKIKQKLNVLYDSEKQGNYNGREMYKNDDIKRIEKGIWYQKRCVDGQSG